ncbi:MAG TPA: SusC/RagA family TonB-linked outer membrane protein [Bacteroidales bacterium]|nr:SusC/RagA family TonB-linked outer membrane protein [Bacteroidales bacterium]
MKKLTILLAFLSLLAFQAAAQMQITGTVKGAEDGMPIPGVSIVAKDNMTIGTVTDNEGKYSLTVTSSTEVIIFSFVGMKTQEVPIQGRSVIDITMEEESLQLAEIVVTGVGAATDKRRIGIAVESVNSDELAETSIASIDNAIAGKIPGALVQSVTGQPGQQQSITLRGINSLTSKNPMILIDGVEINTDNNQNGSTSNFSSRFADIDLSNVDKIEVVQGAAAATIYGAQGANGVIQIFTKKGAAGKTKISLSSNMSVDQMLLNDFKLADHHYFETNAQGYIMSSATDQLSRDPTTGIWTTPLGSIDGTTKVDKPYMEETFDNLDAAFKDHAVTQHYNVTASGGKDKFTFLASASNLNQQSIINGELKKTNLNLNLGFDLTEKITLNLRSGLILGNNTTGGITGIDNRYSPLSNAINTPQYIDITSRDSYGNYVANPNGAGNEIQPLFAFEYQDYYSDLVRVMENFSLDYDINKYLKADIKYGYDSYTNKFQNIIRNQEDLLSNGLVEASGQYTETFYEGKTQNLIASGYLNVDFAKDLGMTIPLKSATMVKWDWRQQDYSRTIITGTGLPAYEYYTIESASSVSLDTYEDIFRTYGFLLNEKLDYGELLGVSFGARIDWSSAFGEGSDPFIFPRGDFYMRLSELGIMKQVKKLIPEWKIRAAYGQAGIQPGPFDRIVTLETTQIGTGLVALSSQSALTNPKLAVQVSKEMEFGTDIVFTPSTNFFNYFKLSATYWDRTSEDVIWDIDVAASSGALTLKDNAFTLASNGFQFGLDVNVYQGKDFSYSTTVNFNNARTVIDKISNGLDIAVGNNFVLKEGYALGTFFGTKPLTSIDQLDSEGNRIIDPADEANYSISSTGYVVDNASKAVVFDGEQQVIGDPTPDFNLSWINNFKVGKFLNFGFQIDWIKGGDIYNQTKQWQYRDMIHDDVDNPVTINGETGAWANYYQSLYSTNDPNGAFVEDGSYIRLRDVSVTIKLQEVLKLKFLDAIDLTLSGRNLLTITNYSGMDPEAASVSNADTYTRGLDQYAFPNFKSFNAALKINF